MPKQLVFIENHEGTLFRGVSAGLPEQVWWPKQGKWAPYESAPKPEGWGRVITREEAESLYPAAFAHAAE